MFIDLTVLKVNREYRKLFLGQTVSYIGSMMTYVAIPYQVYDLTKSSFLVGLVSTIQLIPLLVFALYGGVLADSVPRLKLLIRSEIGLFLVALLFMTNSLMTNPSIWLLFVLAAISSALIGLHRPAMDAIVPQLVSKEHLNTVSALGSLRYAVGAVAGPALAGILISQVGVAITYLIDAVSFLMSVFFLQQMLPVESVKNESTTGIAAIKEGFHYAAKQPVILGTYLVDIIAMLLAFPMALFPQIVDELNQKSQIGYLYAAIPLGAGFVSIFSKPLDKVKRQGAGVILAAIFWGIFVAAMAFGPNVYWMAAALFLAGAADSVSAIFRGTIWNEVIPSAIRGRLGSLNVLSYMIGPLIGNMRAGTLASATSTFTSVFSGGVLCAVACIACICHSSSKPIGECS